MIHTYIRKDDIALSGEDYYSVVAELVFNSGQRQNDTSCATITILDDMITDGMHMLTISLFSNTTAVQLAKPWNATVIIDDIDCKHNIYSALYPH